LKKKKAAQPPEFEEDERGFLKRMWEDKRAAFIACAAGLLLLFGGGLGAIGYTLTSASDSSVPPQVARKSEAKTPPSKAPAKEVPLANTNAAEGALSLSGRELKPDATALDPEANRQRLAEFFAKRDGGKATANEPKTLTPKQTNQQTRPENAAAEKAAKASPAPTQSPPAAQTPANAPEIINLTIIRGIGDKTQAYLNNGGVATMQQLASMSPSDVQAAMVKGNWRGPNRTKEAADWITQAKKITGDESPMKPSNTTVAVAPANASKSATGTAANTKAMTSSTPTQKPPAKIGNPFEKFVQRIELPPSTNTSDLKIGNLVIAKNHLLGLQLLAGPEITKNKVDLKLNRSANDKQLWNVELGVKRSDPIAIAQFQKTPTEMKFRWLPTAAENKSAAALRNCMLKLSTPKDSQWLGLRMPVMIENFKFVDDQGFTKAETEIDSLPNLPALKVELQPMQLKVKTADEKAISLTYQPRQISKRDPGRIFFQRSESSRFFYVEVTADIRKKSRFTAQMMVAYPNSNPQPLRSAGNLVDIARAIEPEKAAAMNLYQRSLQAKKPKDMTVTEFNGLKKEAKDKADDLTKLAKVTVENIAVAKKLSGKQIPLEVYFDMEGHRIVIAKSK
jgi:predicted flap endonuclease-1-like 5' DNA nuclease